MSTVGGTGGKPEIKEISFMEQLEKDVKKSENFSALKALEEYQKQKAEYDGKSRFQKLFSRKPKVYVIISKETLNDKAIKEKLEIEHVLYATRDKISWRQLFSAKKVDNPEETLNIKEEIPENNPFANGIKESEVIIKEIKKRKEEETTSLKKAEDKLKYQKNVRGLRGTTAWEKTKNFWFRPAIRRTAEKVVKKNQKGSIKDIYTKYTYSVVDRGRMDALGLGTARLFRLDRIWTGLKSTKSVQADFAKRISKEAPQGADKVSQTVHSAASKEEKSPPSTPPTHPASPSASSEIDPADLSEDK